MKKTLLVLLMALVICLLPMGALAADGPIIFVGGVELVSGEYMDTNGTVSTTEPDNGYAYLDGSMLTLHDFTCPANSSNAIYVSNASDFTIVLEGENILRTLGNNDYTRNGITFISDTDRAGIATLLLKGDGQLTIHADASDCGIDANGKLTIESGDITIKANSVGIKARSAIGIYGGQCMIKSNADGIEADSSLAVHGGDIAIEAESSGVISNELYMWGGTITVLSNECCLAPDKDLWIGDGKLTLVSKNNTAIDVGGSFTINGGHLLAESPDGSAIRAQDSFTMYTAMLILQPANGRTEEKNGSYCVLTEDDEYAPTVEIRKGHSIYLTCEGNGTASVNTETAVPGQQVTLTAVPDAHYEFSSVNIHIEDTVTEITDQVVNGTYTFTMPESNVYISINFQKIEVTLTATIRVLDENGADCQYFEHAMFSITSLSPDATSDIDTEAGEQLLLSDFTFRNDFYLAPEDVTFEVSDDGQLSIVSGDAAVEQNEDGTWVITIRPERNPLYHSVTVLSEGNGTAQADRDYAQTGKKVQLYCIPDDGYEIKEWVVISGGVTFENSGFVMGTEDVVIKAVFGVAEYAINRLVNHIALHGDNRVLHGQDYTGKLVADNGYNLPETIEITIGDAVLEEGVGYTYDPVTGDLTIAGDYVNNTINIAGDATLITYTVSVLATEGGTASSDRPGCAPRDLVVLTAEPFEGYSFKGWSGMEGLEIIQGSTETLTMTFSMPGHDVTITAEFEITSEDAFIITFTSGEGSGEDVLAAITADTYHLPYCMFTAPEGKQFKAWEIDGTEYQIGSLVSITGDTTVTALWEPLGTPVAKPVITSPTAAQTITVAEGETAALTIQAQNAYMYRWYVDSGDGTGWHDLLPNISSYLIRDVTMNEDGLRFKCVVYNKVKDTVESPVFTLEVIEKVDVPATGDVAPLSLWLMLFLFSGLGVIILLSKRQQKK